MKKGNTPDLVYEKMLLNELSESEAVQLQDEPETKKKLKQLEESNKEILFMYPPENIGNKLKNRLKKERSPLAVWFPRIATAAAAGLLLVITVINPSLPGSADTGNGDGNTGIRIKAATAMRIYKQDFVDGELGAIELADGDTLAENDRLQISYTAGNENYGIIFAVDGNGYVWQYYPKSETDSTLLDQSGKVILPHSIILDNAPYFEKYYFVTSQNEFQPQEVLKAAWEQAENPFKLLHEPLVLPDGFHAHSITFYKEDSE